MTAAATALVSSLLLSARASSAFVAHRPPPLVGSLPRRPPPRRLPAVSQLVSSDRRRPMTASSAPLPAAAAASSSSSSSSGPSHGSRPFRPPPNLRGVFVGSGSDGMSDSRVAGAILDLVPPRRGSSPPTVLYLGTATYDLPRFRRRQTQCFTDRGCTVRSLDVTAHSPPKSRLRDSVLSADVIIVGGGNTLYALDRWKRLGMDEMLREAAGRGAVLTGGSAGAICWFGAGHSDSADPDTFRGAMLKTFGGNDENGGEVADESSRPPPSLEDGDDDAENKEWEYIRIPGLNILPGIVCPHHDMVQSNGSLRSDDFDAMLLRRSDDCPNRDGVGIGIDHWAALVVEGDGRFRVLSLEGKEGSVVRRSGDSGGDGDVDDQDGAAAAFCPDRTGRPGVWIKEVRDGKVWSRLCPRGGKVEDLLRVPPPARDGTAAEAADIDDDDGAVERCRRANPDYGPRPAVEDDGEG